ncbi:MAG: hypothetical protein GY765_17635 [bacterium]|nr:hypothetical protein [bacterium]
MTALLRPLLQNNITLILAVALGLGWLLFIYTAGPGISPDSGHYLGYSFNMHYDGNYYVHAVRPPVYPLLIHFFIFFVGFPVDAAALVSGFSMILLLATAALILQKACKDTLLNCMFLLSIFLYDKFLMVFKMAWSEGPFALFTLLNLYFLMQHHRNPKTKYYLFSAIAVSLAVCTRYMGYALVGPFFLYTLYFLYNNRENKNVSRVKYMLLNSITYLPLFAFLMRNFFFYNKTFHGSRLPAKVTFFTNARRVLNVLDNCLTIYMVLLLVMSLIVYTFFLRRRLELKDMGRLLPLSYILAVVGTYTAILVYTTSRVSVDPVSIRYFSPLLPLFFLFVFFIFQLLNESPLMGNKGKILLSMFLYGFLAATLVVQAKATFRFLNVISVNGNAQKSHPQTAGYARSGSLKSLNEYIRQRLTEEDKVCFIGLHEPPNQLNAAYLAATTFFRRGVLSGPSVSDVSFVDVGKAGYSLKLKLDGKRKRIIYRHLKHARINRELFTNLRELMKELNVESVRLLTLPNEKYKPERIMKLPLLLPAGFEIRSREEVGAYTVYLVSAKAH